jgi:hypothetical protein
MNDRELLEAAARAFWAEEIDDVCSIRWLAVDQAIGYTHADNQDHNGLDREFVWNPLEDDGDALRLAVKMRLELTWWKIGVRAESAQQEPVGIEPFGADPYAATRRAIVRAAASMAALSTPKL